MGLTFENFIKLGFFKGRFELDIGKEIIQRSRLLGKTHLIDKEKSKQCYNEEPHVCPLA